MHRAMQDEVRRPVPERTLAALARVGRRVRRIRVVRAIACACLVVAAFAAGSFAADYVLRLPAGARAIFLLGAVGGLAAVGVRRLVPALRAGTREDEARAVERAQPEFQELLISAVQLSGRDSLAARYVSGTLVEDVIRRAESRAEAIAPARVAPAREAASITAGAIAALAALAIGAALRPDLARIWLARDVGLASVPWPKRVSLRIVEPAGTAVRIARGDDLGVVVEIERGSPPAVEIVAEFPEGTAVESMARLGESTYRKVFANVTSSFSFRVEADDDRSGWIEVEALVRPRIESIAILCRYPPYTGIPPTDPAQPIPHGHVKAPVGTEVAWTARANLPLASARFLFFPEGRADASIDEPVAIGEGGTLAGRFTVATSGAYSFALVSESGFSHGEPVRYRVDAVPDAAPVARILQPGANEEVTARAQVAVEAAFSDDYGVVSARLSWEIIRDDGAQAKAGAIPLAGFESGARTAKAESAIDVGSLGAVAGSGLRYFAEAEDAGKNVGRSEVYRLTVVSPEDLYRLAQDLLVQVREELKETGRLQDRILSDGQELMRTTGRNPRLTEEDAGALVRARIDQRKVSDRLDRAGRTLERILDKLRSNRVGELDEIAWIQGIASEVRALGADRSPEIDRRLAAIRERIPSESVPPSELAGVSALQKALRDEIRDIVERLEGWGDLATILRRIRDLISIEREVQQGTLDLLRR